jgi:predicted TIM-barrel fold metal-dependent hydrolase
LRSDWSYGRGSAVLAFTAGFHGLQGISARGAAQKCLKPSEYFQSNLVITTSGVEDPLALRFCIDKHGAERVMWAIDYPFRATAPAVAFLESAPLSDRERSQIAHRNTERVFRMRT